MTALDAPEATRYLFDAHADAVYRYARFVLRDAGDAEDAVQEIFIKVLRSWDKFQRRSDPKTWLWSIARNHLYDRLRRKKAEIRLLQFQKAEARQQTPSEHVVPDVEMEELLMGLKMSYRQVLILRYMQDMKPEEIALILGWSPAKVRTTLHRAIKTLRAQILQLPIIPTAQWKAGNTLET